MLCLWGVEIYNCGVVITLKMKGDTHEIIT